MSIKNLDVTNLILIASQVHSLINMLLRKKSALVVRRDEAFGAQRDA